MTSEEKKNMEEGRCCVLGFALKKMQWFRRHIHFVVRAGGELEIYCLFKAVQVCKIQLLPLPVQFALSLSLAIVGLL